MGNAQTIPAGRYSSKRKVGFDQSDPFGDQGEVTHTLRERVANAETMFKAKPLPDLINLIPGGSKNLLVTTENELDATPVTAIRFSNARSGGRNEQVQGALYMAAIEQGRSTLRYVEPKYAGDSTTPNEVFLRHHTSSGLAMPRVPHQYAFNPDANLSFNDLLTIQQSQIAAVQ